jgi:hypothetical protein
VTSKPARSRPLLDGLMVLSAPLLILLALVLLLQRQGSDRIQAVPALVIGGSLMVASRVRRQRRRRALLRALRQERR